MKAGLVSPALSAVLVLAPIYAVAADPNETNPRRQASTCPAISQATGGQEQADQPYDPTTSETLTNNWFGLGRKLSEKGLDVTLALTQVGQQNLRGGMSTHRHVGNYTGRTDLVIAGDLEKMGLVPGGSFYVQAKGGWSDGINPSQVGSLFDTNASVFGDEIALSQLWYQQDFFDKKLRVRFGRVDLTGGFQCRGCPASFDGNTFANDDTAQFLNGSLVNNPTIPFPDPGFGTIVHLEPVDWWYFSAAVADADAKGTTSGFDTAFHGPANVFNIYETGVLPRAETAKGPLQGAYRVGLWYDPQAKDRLDGDGVETGDVGFYTSCDQVIWKENTGEDDTQGLGIFQRYGLADAAVNEVKSFWSTGMQYQGLIPSRDCDVVGFGVGQGRLSNVAFSERHETAMELFYNIQITPWMHLSPDVQYIYNPGGGGGNANAVVAGARMLIVF